MVLHGGLAVKDQALSLLGLMMLMWQRLDPWSGNFQVPCAGPRKKTDGKVMPHVQAPPGSHLSACPPPCWLASSWVWLKGDTSIKRWEERETGGGCFSACPWLLRALGFSRGCIRGSPGLHSGPGSDSALLLLWCPLGPGGRGVPVGCPGGRW